MKITPFSLRPAQYGRFFRLAVILMAFTACQTVPLKEEIPADLTAEELSLMGQNALDRNNYAAAEIYYDTVLERYAGDIRAVTAAEYEIAHIRVKQEHWADAKPLLEKIIARYETTGGAGLPPEYLVLARNDLARVLLAETPEAAGTEE